MTTATGTPGTGQRRLRLALTLAGASLSTALAPAGRRGRVELRSAARALTALGVRVQVEAAPPSWPRGGRLVVADRAGWLAERAVVAAALDRSGHPGPPVICPVSIRVRTPEGYLDERDIPRSVSDVLARPGLVVEVRCLPAVGWAAVATLESA